MALSCKTICHFRSASASFRQVEKRIVDNILGEKTYDNRIRPSGSSLNITGTDAGN